MIEVYERDMQYRNHSLIGPLEAPISLSFLDPGFQDNYGGEFVARGLGDGEGLPKHMKDIFSTHQMVKNIAQHVWILGRVILPVGFWMVDQCFYVS